MPGGMPPRYSHSGSGTPLHPLISPTRLYLASCNGKGLAGFVGGAALHRLFG